MSDRPKAYVLSVLVIDFDEVEDGAKDGFGVGYHIENARYPNRCISPTVLSQQGYDIGDWPDDDSHPLNFTTTDAAVWLAEHGKPLKATP